MSSKRARQGAFWIGVYLMFTLAPLFILLIGPTPPGRSFWTEFSVGLGFAGLAIMGMQFLLTARFRHLTQPYGMDIVYHFHRQISWIAFLFVLAHPLILFVENPALWQLLNVVNAPWRARFGLASIVALVILIATSIWRLRLQLQYETWRLLHGVLGTLAIVFAMTHIVLVGNYVETPWKRALWLALSVIWIGLLVYVRLWKPVLMLRRPYRVADVRPERGGAWTLVLQPHGHSGFRFEPGQFAWLTLWHSPYAVHEHPFSFSSSAERNGRLAFTVKELGDFTATIKDATPGKIAYLDGPYGAFSIDRHRADGYVFIAGGVGITPVMSMLCTLADRDDRRHLLLIYANNTWEDIIFREELNALQHQLALEIVHVLNEPPDGWHGETGFVTAEMLKRYIPAQRNSRAYFICGPDPMMDAVEQGLTEFGVSLANIHGERYNFV